MRSVGKLCAARAVTIMRRRGRLQRRWLSVGDRVETPDWVGEVRELRTNEVGVKVEGRSELEWLPSSDLRCDDTPSGTASSLPSLLSVVIVLCFLGFVWTPEYDKHRYHRWIQFQVHSLWWQLRLPPDQARAMIEEAASGVPPSMRSVQDPLAACPLSKRDKDQEGDGKPGGDES
eukprot:Hpha_TRINITY_DN1145_c0_g1::TRINITY_DN1145_c0_g1_i1::g.113204::m.113204